MSATKLRWTPGPNGQGYLVDADFKTLGQVYRTAPHVWWSSRADQAGRKPHGSKREAQEALEAEVS